MVEVAFEHLKRLCRVLQGVAVLAELRFDCANVQVSPSCADSFRVLQGQGEMLQCLVKSPEHLVSTPKVVQCNRAEVSVALQLQSFSCLVEQAQRCLGLA